MLSLFSLLTDYFFFVILLFFLTFLAVSRGRGRSILSLLSAPGLITCVLKVRIVVAESVKGKCCGQYSRVALCAFGLTQCRSSLSVCAQEKAGLICLRLCVGRRKSRCVVVFVLQLQITNNYNNLASIRVGSSAKPAIIQHVSFIFLSVSADAAWLKCAPSRGKSIGVSGSRMSFDTFFNNNLMHYVPAERRGIFGSVLYKIL